jgi:hypothetical protein
MGACFQLGVSVTYALSEYEIVSLPELYSKLLQRIRVLQFCGIHTNQRDLICQHRQ